jgi:hypothetical protein
MSLTLVFLSMRAVMEVGGACAEGGPFVIAQPCPDNVPWLITGGIFGLFIFGGAYFAFASQLGGRYSELLAFAWPALFLSLGWNFFEYAFDPPGEEDGVVGGWLVCGVLFALMGGLPLLFLIRPRTLKAILWAPDALPPRPPPAQPVRAALRTVSPKPTGDLVDDLERLARLRDEGKLSAAEYEQAKRQVLDG